MKVTLNKTEYVGNGWHAQVQKLRSKLKQKRKKNTERNRQIQNDAQWMFNDWAQENTPAVPHHLIDKKWKKISHDRRR